MRSFLLSLALGLLGCAVGDAESVGRQDLAVEGAAAPAAPLESKRGDSPKPHAGLSKAGPARPAPPSWAPTNPEDTGVWNAVEDKSAAGLAAPGERAPDVSARIIALQQRYLKALAEGRASISLLPLADQEEERRRLKFEILGF